MLDLLLFIIEYKPKLELQKLSYDAFNQNVCPGAKTYDLAVLFCFLLYTWDQIIPTSFLTFHMKSVPFSFVAKSNYRGKKFKLQGLKKGLHDQDMDWQCCGNKYFEYHGTTISLEEKAPIR